MEKTVVELFAGVGGFRVGLNHITKIGKDGRAIEHGNFNIIWTNQWEPATKAQHAFDCYVTRFGNEKCSNVDIALVDKENEIPNHALLVGGFPCQDYSVARSLSKEKGIEGKKGVLWWQINEILEKKDPPFVLLENVDRLIKSPSKQRGRDFGIMLRCFNDLDYIVEWRVINAADYGMPQRRRRLYIVAYKNNTKFGTSIKGKDAKTIFLDDGVFAKSFNIKREDFNIHQINLNKYEDVVEISQNFSGKFCNSGILIDGIVYTATTTPIFKEPTTLRQIIDENADEHYYLSEKQVSQFAYLRGSKKIERTAPDGSKYNYAEGSMSPYDDLDLPGRTMLTSEGSTNRSSHIVMDPKTNKLRILTPVECERLNMFPDNWTDTGMPENRRYFMMGNALVCGVIQKIGDQLNKIIEDE